MTRKKGSSSSFLVGGTSFSMNFIWVATQKNSSMSWGRKLKFSYWPINFFNFIQLWVSLIRALKWTIYPYFSTLKYYKIKRRHATCLIYIRTYCNSNRVTNSFIFLSKLFWQVVDRYSNSWLPEKHETFCVDFSPKRWRKLFFTPPQIDV